MYGAPHDVLMLPAGATPQQDRMVVDILSSMGSATSSAASVTLAGNISVNISVSYPGNFTNSTCTTSTLTPTTLRNIGDAFDYPSEVPPPLEHSFAAGFAPPSVIVAQPFNNNNNNNNSSSNNNNNNNNSSNNNNNQRLHDVVEVKREIIEEDAGYVSPWAQDPNSQQSQGLDMNVYQTNLPYTTASDVRPLMSALPSPRKRTQTSSPTQRDTPSRRRVHNESLPPEEEERRRQRRERNKAAAARCRQRRVDQTNELQNEVDSLENLKKSLRAKYEELEKQKKRLQLSIDQHNCMRNNVTRELAVTSASSMQQTTMNSIVTGLPNIPMSQTIVSSPSQVNVIVRRDSLDSHLAEIVPATLAAMPQQTEKRPRPSTLPMSMFEQTGIPIQTPSGEFFSFQSLVEGTGLTPTVTPVAFSPTCTIQQRNSNGDVSTPDPTTRKLVTL